MTRVCARVNRLSGHIAERVPLSQAHMVGAYMKRRDVCRIPIIEHRAYSLKRLKGLDNLQLWNLGSCFEEPSSLFTHEVTTDSVSLNLKTKY